MKYGYVFTLSIILILLSGLAPGCVAPPADNQKTSSGNSTPFQYPTITPEPMPVITYETGENYIIPATPYPTRITPTPDYRMWTRPTPNPDDRVCLIYLTDFNAATGVNKTAATFNLKTPPMYINYTLINPEYISGTKRVQQHSSQPESVTYKQLNPLSYLEITIRNRTTGVIYTQDGFGKSYGQYLAKTIKVTKNDDLLIEFSGYKVTGAIGIWVKPVGNFAEGEFIPTMECKFPQDFGPNYIYVEPYPTIGA